MFEFFRGRLVQATSTKAILDVGGVGYSIQISAKTFQKLPTLGSEIFLYVAPIIREDEHSLYGFLSVDEKGFFYLLTTISGIGPKTAALILGNIEVSDLQVAIVQANAPLLSKIPGIGKKTAQRLIIELKEKLQNINFSTETTPYQPQKNSLASDAISALTNLGHPPLKAQKIINQILHSQKEEPPLPELIILALRAL